MSQIVPIARTPISVRPATSGDLPFIDALQKQHSKQLGYFRTKQFEEYIAMGAVLIAEEPPPSPSAASGGGLGRGKPVGYVISRDRYLKRDELGVIFQLCVTPGEQRKLVGAELIRTVFARSAYGCRLYCCWCAQDLEANHFWQSLGFLPIAFRAGSKGKRRVHIFWERRIREGDATTPYWFPAQTNAGAIREDRVVLPIPPGVRWNDPMPMLIPEAPKALPAQNPEHNAKPKPQKIPTLMPPTRRGARFGPPPANDIPQPLVEKAKPEKKKREKVKADPVLVAKARELRDRYLEQINADPSALLPAGKYDMARQLEAPRQPRLPNAA